MLEGIAVGAATALLAMLLQWTVRQIGAVTRNDRIEQAIKEIQQGQIAILTVLKPLIVAVKGEEHNGDLVKAEKELDEYLITRNK